MKTFILVLILTSFCAIAGLAGEKTMLIRCSAWAGLANMKEVKTLHFSAALIIGATGRELMYEYMWASGFVAGSQGDASQVYDSICKKREQYAKDLIAQSLT